jgi:quinoprotein glucose dehydrogenase
MTTYIKRITGLWLGVLFALAAHSAEESADQWTVSGGDFGGTRFSSLDHLNTLNVHQLKTAWSYRTGDLGQRFTQPVSYAFAATPIFFGKVLYLSTPSNIVIALDPQSGRERWRFDPEIARSVRYPSVTSRGVAVWQDSQTNRTECKRRIFAGTQDARIIALDADTGKPCAEFGLGGSVRIEGDNGSLLAIVAAPLATRDLVVVAAINNQVTLDRPVGAAQSQTQTPSHGAVRAYDARTGALRWVVTTQQLTNQRPRNESKELAIINPSSALSWDAALDFVYVATGSPAAVDLQSQSVQTTTNDLANSVIAIRSNDGSVAWSRQLVHGDIWSYSLTAQPTLIDIERDGESLTAVVQATKMGTLFLMDRETGSPLNEIVEKPINRLTGTIQAFSTSQPSTTIPPLVSHNALSPDDAWGLTFYDRSKCRDLIASLTTDGIFTPPTAQGTIQSPSDSDGIGWGSIAVDRDKQIIVAAVNRLPKISRMVDVIDKNSGARTRTIQRTVLQSPLGLPCSPPPWGTLAAIDLRNNQLLWQRPIGSARGFGPWYMPSREIGAPTVGGPIITAGGLVFAAGTSDNYLRAFATTTGKELWKGKLPASGHATPMTYEYNGKQYVLIVAGGSHQFGATRGDYVVAFAAP